MLVPTDSIRGELIFSEPLKKYTSLRVGGEAEYFFKPADIIDLKFFLSKIESDVPIFWLGRGSNLLVRDGGIKGIVISTSKILKEIIKINDNQVEVGANVPCTTVARKCIRWNMGPSEFFSGIPGSLGGALAMNAGGYGYETCERVTTVRTIDRIGNIHERNPKDYLIEYRQVKGPTDEWFLSAKLRFDSKDTPSIEKQKEMLMHRKNSQPLGLPSCGSVFRNPPNNFAAKLIEESNLKGYRIGGAEISKKHANFIITDHTAISNDVEQLINHIRATVKKIHNVDLQCEVKIVGDHKKII